MEEQTLIEAQDLSRLYGRTAALSGLSLALRKGEILGLLGPNGAGKTTTMKILAGCLAPSGGSVKINGIDLAERPAAAKASLGYLPEQPPLYPELTVDEYLGYAAGLHGVPPAQRADAVARAKQACGLGDVARRLIHNLSKGYQQRVGLAQAIIHRPPVIILDEPTVGLDPIQIREIRALIKDLGQSHGIILSSHILPEIQAVCSRVMIINKGRVVYAESIERTAQHRMDSLVVGLRRGPDAGALRQIAGVERAEQLEAGLYRLTVAGGADPREALAEAAVRNGWGLVELRSQAKTLEEVFVELTSGEVTLHETLQEAA
ncbi:MAG: ATP-binding cassette domain-containing protein [Nevskia sp.]|nr:ATP-binding cassette domain-containing protein [Nevskia sp.]